MEKWWIGLIFAAAVNAQGGAGTEFRAAPARKTGKKVKLVPVRAGHATIRIPEDWRCAPFEQRNESVRSFLLWLPGGTHRGMLFVQEHRQDSNPRGGPAWTHRYERQHFPGSTWELKGDPLPHCIVRHDFDGEKWMDIKVFVRASGHTFKVEVRAHATDFDQALPDLLEAASTLTTTAPEWPPVSKEYRIVRVGPYRMAVHRSVHGSVRPFTKSIRAAQKAADALHGRMPKPADGEPAPVVYLHSDRSRQEAIQPRLKGTTNANSLWLSGLCIYAMTKHETVEDTAANLVYTVGEFNTFWRWGTAIPQWLRVGERIVVANMVQTGGKLPVVTPQRAAWRDGLELKPLPELTDELCSKDWDSFFPQAFFYVAFFHAGPEKYQRAYRAYLDHIEKTCDINGAAKLHLDPLGYDQLRADAVRFMANELMAAEKDE